MRTQSHDHQISTKIETIPRLVSYEAMSGPRSEGPSDWPQRCKLKRTPGRYSLVLFAHPYCPCTRSTIHELAKLMERSDQLDTVVCFIKPGETALNWADSDIYRETARIPGVSVYVDTHLSQTKLFGAKTSGEGMLYAPDGHLVFSGGITAGRGHEGDNQGLMMVLNTITQGCMQPGCTPVYGCSLQDDKNPNLEAFRR